MNQENAELHVVFGAGPVGRAVADALALQGKRTRIVNRAGVPDAPAGAEVVRGDVLASSVAKEAAAGAAIIYNCLNPPYHQWPAVFPLLQEAVLDAASTSGAKLVVMENVYMYGPTGGRPLTEELPYAATTRKGVTRAKMARELLSAHAEGRARIAIGRASDFFGPHALGSSLGERVFFPALRGKSMQVVGDVDQPHTYSYVPDIGRALVILGENDAAFGRAWHIPSPETVSTRKVLEMVAAESGVECRIQIAPALLLKALGLFNKDAGELVEMIYEFKEPFILDHSAFQSAFDFQPTGLPEAIRATVAWYRSQA